MKHIYSILCAILMLSMYAHAQFFRTDGSKFLNPDGTEFYPVMINYYLSVGYPYTVNNDMPAARDFFISPHGHYNGTGAFPCNDNVPCVTYMENDFDEMVSLNFNTIRLVICPHWKSNLGKFTLFGSRNGGAYVTNDIPLTNQVNGGFLADDNTDEYFDQLEAIISSANSKGLKVVILLFGLEGSLSTDNNNQGDMSQYMLDETSDLLTAFGSRFKNHTNILGYEYGNEFSIGDQNAHTKSEICQITTDWYNSIRSTDPNHLISISGHDVESVGKWDFGVMKIDFYQPHLYPVYNDLPTYDLTLGLNTVLRRLYWLKNNCTMPWLIGETGFRAQTTNNNPFLDGTLSNQDDYLSTTLDWCRNCKGAGYGWWQYQNFLDPITNVDGFGVLTNGTVTSIPSSLEKPIGTTFRNYANPTPPSPNTSLCVEPTNYYDPYDFASYNTNETGKVYGIVKDVNNQPIKDAVVTVWNYISDPSHYPGIVAFNTFTKADGTYEVIPFDPAGDHRIYAIMVSAVGMESVYFPWNDWSNQNQIPSPIDFTNTTGLSLSSLNYYTTIQQTTINSNQLFMGDQNLDLTNNVIVTNTGSADFTAEESIHITPLFASYSGSTTHIYTSPVGRCSDISFRMPKPNTPSTPDTKIEISVNPNPTSGLFTLNFGTVLEEPVNLVVMDVLGKVVISKKNFVPAVETQLDLSEQSKGVYLLQVHLPDGKCQLKKIVVQ